jgi:hypothetical protein
VLIVLNSGSLTYWIHRGLSRSLLGLLYIFFLPFVTYLDIIYKMQNIMYVINFNFLVFNFVSLITLFHPCYSSGTVVGKY